MKWLKRFPIKLIIFFEKDYYEIESYDTLRKTFLVL